MVKWTQLSCGKKDCYPERPFCAGACGPHDMCKQMPYQIYITRYMKNTEKNAKIRRQFWVRFLKNCSVWESDWIMQMREKKHETPAIWLTVTHASKGMPSNEQLQQRQPSKPWTGKVTLQSTAPLSSRPLIIIPVTATSHRAGIQLSKHG